MEKAKDILTTERLDALLEDEIRKGFRIKEVPEELQMLVKSEGITPFERVRFTRPNPRRKAKIADAVQKRYHADLKNPDILSNEQISKFVEERGEWTPIMAEKMFNLLDETQRLQGELYVEGIGEADWQAEMLTAAAALRDELEKADYKDVAEKQNVLAILERWSAYMPSHRGAYTQMYAKDQDLAEYSVDRDLVFLMDRMPSEASVAALHTLDDLRDKAVRYMELQMKRRDLVILQNKHAKIFADSVESRRDQSEEMARVYFCSEQVDAEDKPLGALAKTLDLAWDLPEEMIRWLIIEHYFFANGLPDAARDYLETFGFLKAERGKNEETTVAGDSAPSVESPAPQSSKADTTPQEETAVKSLE